MRNWGVLAAVIFIVPLTAAANGRAPQTNGVYLHPDEPQTLYVRATFGLLISKDGCGFRWVCEGAIGYGGDFDPKYAVAADGTIFATTFEGLRVSRDGGCSWSTATADRPAGDPGNIADIWVDAIDISPTGEVWVATAHSGRPNDVYSSSDNGLTFTPRGQSSPTIWWKSVKVARSDPQRVYLTGYQVAGLLDDGGQSPPRAHLTRSGDGGQTWTAIDLTTTSIQFAATPIALVVAIDPQDPSTILLSALKANGEGDRLYRSTDGGETFTEVLATNSSIKDVWFGADGSVYVASLTGSHKSSDRGASFTPMSGSPQLQCIASRADGQLVGCGANWEPDFKAVAVSDDGGSWSKLFRFVELAGPLACPAQTSVSEICAPIWPALKQQFGATETAACHAAPDASPPMMPPATKSNGCCQATGSSASVTGTAVLLLLVWGGAWLGLIARHRARSLQRSPASPPRHLR